MSKAYAYSVAAMAGYVTAEHDYDRDGIDLIIQAGGDMRPAIGFQLKATVNLGDPVDGDFRFPLKIDNYNKLRIPTQTPRLLVVLDLPREQERWMTITTEELVLRRRAYWVDLKGCEESDNRFSITVRIPSENLFDVDSLKSLMEQSRQGGIR